MKIVSITLYNFRQFYGKQTIKFSTDDFKNITLIHAENGVGKTALLNAIRWCFFGETTQNFKDSNILLNHSAANEKQYEYSVEIIFSEDEKYYTCIRGINFKHTKFFHIYQNTDSHDTSISHPDLFINSIIPKDMADYFFFQGEGIGSLTQSSTGANNKVKSAIHKVLGFTIAKQTISDLQEIKKEYNKEIKKLDLKGEIFKLNDEIIEIENKLIQAKNRLEKAYENISMYELKIAELDHNFNLNNQQLIQEHIRQRKHAENELKQIEDQLKNKQLNRKKLISRFGFAIFGAKLAHEALDFINEEEFKGTIPAPYNENLVKQILEEKNCICGADIHYGSSAFENIKKLLENAADPLQGSRVIRAREILKSIRDKSADANFHIIENIKDLDKLMTRYNELKGILAQISLKLENTKIDDISLMEKNRKNYQTTLASEHRQTGSQQSIIERYEKELTFKQNQIKQKQSLSKDLIIYQDSLEIINKVENLISNTLVTAEQSMASELPSMINNLLAKYVREDYKAAVNKNTYEIRLIDREGRKVAESDGQQLLLSLTFISCLIEFASKRKNASGEILTPGAIAPFIIDAPFGVLDNKYKGNMAKSIPDSVEQVVFLLSSSHWEGSVEQNIRERVGSEYNLVAEIKTAQGEKESYTIDINGNKYDTARYNSPIDCTKIEEVN